MSSSTTLAYSSLASEKLLPPGKMDPAALKEFVRKRVYRNSRLYMLDYSRFRKSELYDQSSQWIRRAYSTSDSTTPAQWEQLAYNPNDPNAIPLPVYNEGVLLRENESARLGRPEYKPRVRPSSPSPDIKEKEGAEGAERALSSRLKEMWSSQEDLFFLHPPLYGGVWLESRWEETWLDTVRVPAPALCCPRHPKSGVPPERQGPPLLSPANLGGTGEAVSPVGPLSPAGPPPASPVPEFGGAGGGSGSLSMEGGALPPSAPFPQMAPPPPAPCTYVRKKVASELEESNVARPFDTPDTKVPHEDEGCCPICADRPTLVPFSPTLAEAMDPNPATSLGRDLPKGDWFLRVRTPYQIFPRDAGIGVDPTDLDEWVYVHVETLEWAETRWPDKIRDLSTGELRVHPENAATLMVLDPTLGAASLLAGVQNLGVYREHVVVAEFCKKPWLEWDPDTRRYAKNLGRHVIVVQDTPVFDSTLLVKSLNDPNEYVPRVRLEYVPWEYVDGGRRSTVGQSLWDRVFDAQDGLNERIAQVRAVNQRGALPWYLQQRGLNFETAQADSAVPFRRVLADFEGTSTQLPLQIMNNSTIASGVYEELSFTVSYINKQLTEVEKGQVPPGVGAATAIAYLKTESGEKRRPRIKRLRDALVRAWDHGTKCMAAFYIEDRPYSYQDENGEEKHAFIHGKIIAASKPRVDIYPAPDYDKADLTRENIRDMVQQGILNPTQTPKLNRKIVKAMDESLDFFTDDDLQEEQARREWGKFKDENRVPVVDPSLDDHQSHYENHGEMCFSEWFRLQEDLADWDGALQILGGDWDESLKNLAMSIAMPPMPMLPPGIPGAPSPMPGPMPPQIPGQTGLPMVPPPPPALQSQILTLWQQKLLSFVSPDPKALGFVTEWRSHMEAHKLTGEIRQLKQALAAAPPTMEAPGAGSSPTSPAEAQAGTPQ